MSIVGWYRAWHARTSPPFVREILVEYAAYKRSTPFILPRWPRRARN